MKHLEEDYEVSEPPSGIVHHFFDTIRVIGGWKALVLIAIGIVAFYWYLLFAIQSGRKRRELEKERKKRK
jgi:hypothetical protein